MNLRVKWVFRRDTIQGFYRLARIMWERGEPGQPGGYSAKLSFAADPCRPFGRVRRDASTTGWRFTVLGLRLHYCRSYGGRFA